MNPSLDQRPILLPSAKTIERKVLSDSRKEHMLSSFQHPFILCFDPSVFRQIDYPVGNDSLLKY